MRKVKTKAELREEKRRKEKDRQKRGATLSGQISNTKTSRFYRNKKGPPKN